MAFTVLGLIVKVTPGLIFIPSEAFSIALDAQPLKRIGLASAPAFNRHVPLGSGLTCSLLIPKSLYVSVMSLCVRDVPAHIHVYAQVYTSWGLLGPLFFGELPPFQIWPFYRLGALFLGVLG